jgi:glycine rich protein
MAKRYNLLTRCLAAVALLFVYVASTSAVLVGATTSPAQAYRGYRGGYRGGGWGYRGGGYRRGWYPRGGYGYYGYGGRRCWWSPRGVRVCRW